MLHLIKLCVGVSSVEELTAWQDKRLAHFKATRQPQLLDHVTRQTPKKSQELSGGSLYWIINGEIACRQALIGFEPVMKNNLPHCRIVLAPETVRVQPRPHRPFQGWRYLKSVDAPGDLLLSNDNSQMDIELRNIGLI